MSAATGYLIALILLTAFGTSVLAQTTTVDPTFIAVPSLPLLPTDGSATSVQQAIQADGKILVWGGALAVQGVAKGILVRLNSDGTLDNSFSYCHCVLDGVSNAAPLPDGKMLVGGSASSLSKVIRLNGDGTLDTSFNYVNPPNQIGGAGATIAAVQSDGRFFVARRQAFQGFSEIGLYHFNADGSRDMAFTAVAIGSGSPNFTALNAVRVLPDGRFWVAQTTRQITMVTVRPTSQYIARPKAGGIS